MPIALSNIVILLWLSTKFSNLSDGYPDMRLYRICVLIKVVQSFIVVIVQITVLCKLQSYGFHSLSLVTQVFLCISIASSIISLVITVIGVVLQANMLKSLSDDESNRDRTISVSNPLSAVRIGIQSSSRTMSSSYF